MISNPSVKRLLWKDYCEYSGLWWAMLVGSLLFFWVIVGIEVAQRHEATLPLPVVEIATFLWLAIAVCFPAAVGATSFSREHEQETFVFLRSLPIHSRTVLFCRCALVAFATILLFVLFFGVAIVTSALSKDLTISHANLTEAYGMLALSMMVAIEAFLIGVFFSLLTKHPLGALLMTGVTMMLIHGTALSGTFVGAETEIYAWQLLVLASAIAFGILDFIRIPQWFREGDAWGSGSAGAISSKRTNLMSHSAKAKETSARRTAGRGIVRSLIWQQWRQLGFWYLFAIAFGLLILLVPNGAGVFGMFVALVLVASSVFFHEKQNRRYRFLSQRGVHPFKVWMARNVILLPVIAIPCAYTAYFLYEEGPEIVGLSCLYAFAPLIAFVIVQFCILVTEQYIVGLVIAFLTAALAIGWCLQAAILSLPFELGFVPLLLGGLAAGYKRLADLLNEKNRTINKCIAWSILVGTVVVMLTATAFYRVYSIPATSGEEATLLELSKNTVTRTDAQNTAFENFQTVAAGISSVPNKLDGRFYFEHLQLLENPGDEDESYWVDSDGDSMVDTYRPSLASSLVRGEWTHNWENVKTISPEEDAWLTENQLVLPQVIQAVAHPEFANGRDDDDADLFSWQLDDARDRTVRLLVAAARMRTAAGDLDDALAKYKLALKLTSQTHPAKSVHLWLKVNYLEQMILENLVRWAGHEDQTKDRIVDVMRWLAERHVEPPNPAPALAVEYSRYRNVFSTTDLLEQMLDARRVEQTTLVYRLMPWEKVRSRRLFDYVSVHQQKWVLAQVQELHGAGPYDIPRESPMFEYNRALNNTLVTSWLVSGDASLLRLALDLENRRRAVMWQLRLVAHRIQHGDYPELMDDVDKLVEFRDTDVLTGLPFKYERSDVRALLVNEPLGAYYVVTDTPLLTSPTQYWSGQAGRLREVQYWLP